jgi:hypothetical protein
MRNVSRNNTKLMFDGGSGNQTVDCGYGCALSLKIGCENRPSVCHTSRYRQGTAAEKGQKLLFEPVFEPGTPSLGISRLLDPADHSWIGSPL